MSSTLDRLFRGPKLMVFWICVLLAAPLYAHHGWGGYNLDFDMEATVVRLKFIYPHDQVFVEDDDGNLWNFMLAPPIRNREFGYDESSIAVGQRVRIIGQRAPNKFEGKVHFIYDEAGENIYTYYYTENTNSWDKIHEGRR